MLNNSALFLGSGLGTMLIARVLGSREAACSLVLCMLIWYLGWGVCFFIPLYVALLTVHIILKLHPLCLCFPFQLQIQHVSWGSCWVSTVGFYHATFCDMTKLMVAVFVVVCILFLSIYPDICFVHSISMIQHAFRFVKHLAVISFFWNRIHNCLF